MSVTVCGGGGTGGANFYPYTSTLFCETRSKRSVEVYRVKNVPLPPQTVTDIIN